MENLGLIGFAGIAMLVLAVVIAAFVGWIKNIVKIARTVDQPLTGMFILRCIGVFIFVLGAILGYL